MSHSPRDSSELFTIVERFIMANEEGSVTDGQLAEFQQLLRGSDEARRLYADYVQQSVFLPRLLASMAAKSSLPLEAPRSPLLGFLNSALHISGDSPGVTAFMWLVMAVLGGMTLMAVLMLVLTIRGVHVTVEPSQESRQQAASRRRKAEGGRRKAEGESKPQSAATVAVARLNRVAGCQWTLGEDEEEPAVGDDLVEGQVLRLKSGLAEILFRSGAKTLLQGPARLELLSRSSVQLHRGTLTARVEVASAKGFTVHTPAMRLVDLGTEFGVMVNRDGAEEVHVFRGTVQTEAVAEGGRRAEGGKARVDGGKSLGLPPSAFPLPPSPLVLSANQALRFDAEKKTVVRQAAVPERFVRAMGEPERVPFPIFGTGMGLDVGVEDPHWQITAVSTQPDFRPQPAVVVEPIGTYPRGSQAKGQWLMLDKKRSPMPRSCRWTFRTQFDLTGFDPATARIEGQLSVDDNLVELRVNGQPAPRAAWSNRQRDDWRWTQLKIDQGFVAGMNTVEIVIENSARAGQWMGLMVQWKGTAKRLQEK